ncbi:MAG: hypothetical protein EHM20_10150 [Alphaproteobacteria bacterium]|nr:MAG: hypothetical protein EHM20_10150 [Alphaproteobacteria bacterium]
MSETDIAKWEVILRELGYEAISQETFYGNNFKKEWCKKIGEIEINIELHTKLFFHLKSENWQFENTQFPNITKLKSEDLFIHLCGHLASQHTFLKLYWLFDIYFYFQKNASSMDWNYLQLKSKDHRLYRSVQMCLWILKQHFDVPLEKKIVDQFEINNKHWWEKLLTTDFLMYPTKSRSRYFLLKHATKDHLSAALHYDLSWFFHYKLQKFWSK